jgi:hypothetical protein
MSTINLADLLVLSLANYAVAITITTSLIFAPVREFVKDHSLFFGNLISCPYCTGVWTASGFILAAGAFHNVIDYFINAMAVVGLSALFSYTWIKIAGFQN